MTSLTPRAVRAASPPLQALLDAAADCLRREPERAATMALEALRRSRSEHAAAAEAAALRHAGNALLLAGDFPRAAPLLQEGVDAARALGDAVLEASCLNGLGVASMRLGDYEQALHHLRAFLQRGDQLGPPRARVIALTNIAAVCEELGDHAEAERSNRLALQHAGDDADAAATAQLNLAVLLALKGRFAAALPHYDAAWTAAERRGDVALQAHVLANAGKTRYLHGERDRGIADLRHAVGLAENGPARAAAALAQLHLGQVLAHARRAPEAGDALRRALDIAQAIGQRYYQREAHRALAAWCARAGAAPQALRHARAHQRIDAALNRTRADARTQALRVQLQVERERHEAERLADRNRRLRGANHRLKAERDALQSRLGVDAAPRTPRPSKGPLDAREQAVLALLAQGLSNAAIARALGLSPYTVRDRVSALLAKLGVDTRAAAAAWAGRNGLDG